MQCPLHDEVKEKAMSNTVQDVQAFSSHTNLHKFGEIQ
jgi:hypothetical protein